MSLPKRRRSNIDMLVMDDGWFENVMMIIADWVTGLVNEKKLGTLGNLIERINDLGVKFGIWIEPENGFRRQ